MSENKVKYNLRNVHYAMLSYNSQGEPVYGTPIPIPGAVELSLEANGEPESFYADGIAYYVINNNMGYEGDLTIALIPDSFRINALGEKLDSHGLYVESTDAQLSHFALLFEFDGDVRKIRHVMYNCTASRPSVSSKTNEESIEIQTETLSIKATPLENGYVKSKTSQNTDAATYNGWYSAVVQPTIVFTATPTSLTLEQGASGLVTLQNIKGTVSASVKKDSVVSNAVTATINGTTSTIAVSDSATEGSYVITYSDNGTTPASTANVTVTVTENES